MGKKHLFSILTVAILSSVLFLSSCKSKKVLTDARDLRNKPKITGSVKERYSVILDVPEREIKNDKLYSFVDDWMGTPHRLGGMDKKGIDCSGLTTILEREIYNKSLPRSAKEMAGQVKRKFEEDLEEGDLVFLILRDRNLAM